MHIMHFVVKTMSAKISNSQIKRKLNLMRFNYLYQEVCSKERVTHPFSLEGVKPACGNSLHDHAAGMYFQCSDKTQNKV